MSCYLVDKVTIDKIVTYLVKDTEYYLREWGVANAQELASKLIEMNEVSVNARYNNSEMFGEYKFMESHKSEIEVYKAMQCLRYQCLLGGIRTAKTFSMLETAISQIADSIISRMKEYQDAKWW